MTGARLAELVYSRRSNHKPLLKGEIDWKNRMVAIRSAKQRDVSVQKIRKVQVDEATLELLRMEVLATSESWPCAFRATTNLARDFDATLVRAGIEKVNGLGQKLTLHSFRHTYATFIGEALGANPFLVQSALGHSQITTSARYCHAKAPQVIPVETLRLLSKTEGGVKGRCQEGKTAQHAGG